MNAAFQQYLGDCQQQIDQHLSTALGSPQSPFSEYHDQHLTRLFDAMLYSLLNGGKRVRPLLLFAAAQAVSGSNTIDALQLNSACALEMIHSYSLVHDDLPAMDDDDLRRGKPTCHRAFDEATAILAGDGMQARAFELLATQNCDTKTRVELVATLARAAGPVGMVGGQAMDLAAVDQAIDLDHLQAIHQLKTGALIRAAVAMGAICSGASDTQLKALDDYALAIGLSFQVQDDILDVESDTATLGKQQGADIALNKPTYPALLGLEGAREKAAALRQQALAALDFFGLEAEPLRQLSAFIINRSH
jgi:geranylgeranyl pyrophosphate synthase